MEDRRPDRMPASALLALALHAALVLAFGLFGDIGPSAPPVPVTVTFETVLPLEPHPRAPVEAPRAATPVPQPPPSPAATPSAAPAASAPAAAAAPAPAARPAPVAPRRPSREDLRRALGSLSEPAAAPSARAPASSAALPPATSPSAANLPPVPVPFEPNADKGRAGPSVAPAAAAAPAPRPELDLRSLDRALSQGTSAGSGAGTPGSGAAAAPARAGASGTGVNIEWETPGTERRLLAARDPIISASPEMLPLDAVVGFTVEPSGLVSSVELRKSTGFAQIDAEFLKAVRGYRFERAPGPAVVKGRRSFVVREIGR